MIESISKRGRSIFNVGEFNNGEIREIREKRSFYYLEVIMSLIEVNEVNSELMYLKFEVIDMYGCNGVSLGEVE
jgi:hypothetical protein